MEMGENISPSPSLLLQGDECMGELTPITHVCVSGEVDRVTIFGIEEETAKENQLVIYLKLRVKTQKSKIMPLRERRE